MLAGLGGWSEEEPQGSQPTGYQGVGDFLEETAPELELMCWRAGLRTEIHGAGTWCWTQHLTHPELWPWSPQVLKW